MPATSLLSALRAAAAPLSPRHRRWRRLLASLALDPDRLAPPIAAPAAGDFIVCGAPRTGTTLLAAMLYQPPAVVTAMEPWDGLRLAPAELFASIRREIDDTGRLSGSKLDVGEPETLLAEVSAFLGLPLARSPARVKVRETFAALSEADAHLLAELCTTATALGYPLERAEAVRPEAPSRLVAR
jgi:hypothetical protein